MSSIQEEMARLRGADLRRAAEKERSVASARGAAREGNPMRRLDRRWARRALDPMASDTQLREVPLFAGLGKREIALLARAADPVRFQEGAILSSETAPKHQFLIITSGVAEATLAGRRLAVLGPGDHAGELALLDAQAPAPTLTALTDLQGYVLSRREFLGALHAIPALSMRLAARVASQLRRAQRRLVAEHAKAS